MNQNDFRFGVENSRILCCWQPLNQCCIPVKGGRFMSIYVPPGPVIPLFNNINLGHFLPSQG